MRPAQHGQLALLLEVCGTPKPGNVDRHHEYPDLRFEHFLVGAVGAYDGLLDAENGGPLGAAFKTAVGGMSHQSGGNTQFGALLLLIPLVRAAASGSLSSRAVTNILEATTVEDTIAFYRAFDHVDVAVDDPPAGLEELDVRAGAAAIESITAQDVTWYELMEASAAVDGVAREWVSGFERSFDAADRLRGADGPVSDRAASVFLGLLAEEPDTFLVKTHDADTAAEATARAQSAVRGDISPDALADEFVAQGINPGTTADIVAAGLFLALEQGLRV